MKKIALLLFGILFAISTQAQVWETDYEVAVAKAKKENKALLLNFTGSDWCLWCIKLDKKIFSQKEFEEYAKENLVLVMVDFPSKKPQSEAEKIQNDKLSAKYFIRSFPTVLLLDANEKVLSKMAGYPREKLKRYLEEIDLAIAKQN